MNEAERVRIATLYAGALHAKNPTASPAPKDFHLGFADAILRKDAYALQYLANGLNDTGKKVFSEVTGIELPKTQSATWKAIRQWAGISDADDAIVEAQRQVAVALKTLKHKYQDEATSAHAWVKQQIDAGYARLVIHNRKYYLVNRNGDGFDLSKRGTNVKDLRPLIEAELQLQALLEKHSQAEPQKTTEPAAA